MVIEAIRIKKGNKTGQGKENQGRCGKATRSKINSSDFFTVQFPA